MTEEAIMAGPFVIDWLFKVIEFVVLFGVFLYLLVFVLIGVLVPLFGARHDQDSLTMTPEVLVRKDILPLPEGEDPLMIVLKAYPELQHDELFMQTLLDVETAELTVRQLTQMGTLPEPKEISHGR